MSIPKMDVKYMREQFVQRYPYGVGIQFNSIVDNENAKHGGLAITVVAIVNGEPVNRSFSQSFRSSFENPAQVMGVLLKKAAKAFLQLAVETQPQSVKVEVP